MKKNLVSFLGTTNYVPLYYGLYGKKTNGARKFAQVAVAELLSDDASLFSAYIFTTKDAKDKNWQGLYEEWKNVFKNEEIKFIEIPDGKSENELWQIFNRIGELLREIYSNSQEYKLVIDITHGFRMYPASLIMAVQFYKNLYNFEVDGIYYGAFEAVEGVPQNVSYFEYLRNISEIDRAKYVAPVFDLTPMISLSDWSAFYTEWKVSGRADNLIKTMDNIDNQIRRAVFSKESDKTDEEKKEFLSEWGTFQEFYKQLGILNDMISLNNVEQIFKQSRDIINRLSNTKEKFNDLKSKFPFLSAINEIQQKINDDLTLLKPDDNNEILNLMFDISRWYLSKERIVETYTVLRELIVTITVIIVNKLNIKTFDILEDKEERDRYFGMLYAYLKEDDLEKLHLTQSDMQDMIILSKFLKDNPSIKEVMGKTFSRIVNYRNNIDHCFIGAKGSLDLAKAKKVADECISKLMELVVKIYEVLNLNPKRYLMNSSVITSEGVFKYIKISLEEARDWLNKGEFISAIGYQETADAIEYLTGKKIDLNRVEVRLEKGDEALVFKITKRVSDPEKKGQLSKEFILNNYEFGIIKKIE